MQTMSSDGESRTILLRNIGRLEENYLRKHYQCLETSPGEKVVEAVFTPEGQDSALVIFTHEKFVTNALNLDRGDVEVTRPPTQMFSSVSATVHESIPQAMVSPTAWQMIVKGVMKQHGVDVHDLVIQGSWLQVEMCRLTLMKMYTECENATGKTTMGVVTEDVNLKVTRPPTQIFSSVSATVHEKVPQAMASSWQKVVERMRQNKVHIHHLEILGGWLQVEKCGLMLMDMYTECQTRDVGNREDHAVAGASSHSRDRCTEAYTDVPLKTYEVASTRVHVHEGDITKMNVDVIVNAANRWLDHGGGVAEAIAWAAGPEFTRECDRIIRERREIDDGNGVMTSSGRLLCKKVYHVVGPMWYDYENKNDCLHILRQAFTNCLMASKDYTSIAIPAISSGIFGVPTELVAKTMCEAVTKFCQSHQSRLRVIHLVDINTAMVKLLQENFEQQSSTSEENSQKSALPSSGDPGGDHKQGCHICRTVYDMLQGNQPKSGTMHSTICSTALPGYSCRTIVIEYSFPDGTQTGEHPHPGQPFYGTDCRAYLPDNQDGRRILDLLKRAFKQRLTFTVGRSVTSGQDDCVTWNDIHHKTSQYDGTDRDSYPDKGYLQRVTEDLAAKGIK